MIPFAIDLAFWTLLALFLAWLLEASDHLNGGWRETWREAQIDLRSSEHRKLLRSRYRMVRSERYRWFRLLAPVFAVAAIVFAAVVFREAIPEAVLAVFGIRLQHVPLLMPVPAYFWAMVSFGIAVYVLKTYLSDSFETLCSLSPDHHVQEVEKQQLEDTEQLRSERNGGDPSLKPLSIFVNKERPSMNPPRGDGQLSTINVFKDQAQAQRQNFRLIIHQFARTHGLELPRLTFEDLKHEWWWREWQKSIARKTIQRTIQEQKAILDDFNELRKSYIDWVEDETAFELQIHELEKAQRTGELTDLEMQVKVEELTTTIAKLQMERAQYEATTTAVKNPPAPVPAPIDPVAQAKLDLEVAQLRAEIAKIENPTNPLTPEEKLEQKAKRYAHLNNWEKSWPENMTPEERAFRQRILTTERMRLMESVNP